MSLNNIIVRGWQYIETTASKYVQYEYRLKTNKTKALNGDTIFVATKNNILSNTCV